MLFGMCKSQYDIEVEQQRTQIERKKDRDLMKQLHAHFGFQPPRSPISPTPPEVEIPSFHQQMRTMINSNMINEYGSMFFESGEGSSSSAAPPPPPGSEEVPQPYSVPQGPEAYPPPFGAPVVPPPPPHDAEGSEAPPDWAGHISTEIFDWSGYPPPDQGMDDDLHVHIYPFTISSVSLLHYLIS
jgi:hypothetical protein